MLDSVEQRHEETPPKSQQGARSFAQRKNDILKQLQDYAERCVAVYKGRKRLAHEKDYIVAELCDTLDEALNYGLRQENSFVATAASLFQNMQEIVTGNSTSNLSNETSFWDFCQVHLSSHERERFENLKYVWTKPGRGKAFIRAALNENSMQRYFLIWQNDQETLKRYYTHWSLLLDDAYSSELTAIFGSLDQLLFALTVDAIELNKAISIDRTTVVTKEEPIIYAPTPKPTVKNNKKRANPIERPIVTASPVEDNKNVELTLASNDVADGDYVETTGIVELAAAVVETSQIDPNEQQLEVPCDPIEPELEFLKQPLPDVYPDHQTVLHVANNDSNSSYTNGGADDDDDDSSSQYSKTSSANGAANCAVLEEKLREMSERYALLETRVAQLTLENRQLLRRLTRYFKVSGVDPSSSFATNFLITIPNVKLMNAGRSVRVGRSYYAYEIHITMRQCLEHWSILRRYQDFYKLHKTLQRSHPSVAVAVTLPPKKHFGNKNIVFVEERRQQLQIYLLSVVECLPQVEACKTKVELQKAFPFLREV